MGVSPPACYRDLAKRIVEVSDLADELPDDPRPTRAARREGLAAGEGDASLSSGRRAVAAGGEMTDELVVARIGRLLACVERSPEDCQGGLLQEQPGFPTENDYRTSGVPVSIRGGFASENLTCYRADRMSDEANQP